MGFFSQGNYGSIDYLENVNEDSSYSGYNGAYRSIVEGYENDRIMFEAMLAYDFHEAALLSEGAGSDELMALNENMITSFFSKLKELFKKLWSKIKAIFNGFIAKFQAKLGSDNKAFAKKYKKEIYRKNLTHFEAKYEKPKNIETFITLSDAKAYSITVKERNAGVIKSAVEDYDEDDETGKCLKVLSGCPDADDPKDFEKVIHEWCFEDKDTIEGETEVKTALTHLEGADKTISNIKKASEKIQRAIESCIKDIDKMDNDYFKNLKWDADIDRYTGASDISKKISYNVDTTGKEAIRSNIDSASSGKLVTAGNDRNLRAVSTNQKQTAQNIISLLSKKANTVKNAFNKVSAACLKEAKFYIAQDRMLVAKAVAYRPKNESTELVSQEEMDFFGDIAAWEVESELR